MRMQMPEPIPPRPDPIPVNDPPPNDEPFEIPPGDDPEEDPLPLKVNRRTSICSVATMAASLFALSAVQSTASAQPRDNPVGVAVDINIHRSGLYQHRDIDAVTSLYTPAALYIQLMPILEVLKGRGQIRGHFEQLIRAGAVDIAPTVRTATFIEDAAILVAGNYSVISRVNGAIDSPADQDDERSVSGHFSQILQQGQDGIWRIAMHVFARAEAVTARELDMTHYD